MITWKRWFALCCTLCLLVLSPCLKAQQSADGDTKALIALLEKHYTAFMTAYRALDLPTMRALALPDLHIESRGRVRNPLEEITTLLADPVKNQNFIALLKRGIERPQSYAVQSAAGHGDDASSVITTTVHTTLAGQTSTTVFTATVDWKRVENEWKLAHISSGAGEVQSVSRDPATLPKWAVAFNKAVALIGKSKAQIVEAFGPPVNGDDTRYHYVLDSQRRSGQFYDQVAGHMTTISRVQTTELDFALEGGRVTDITLNFDTAEPTVAVFSSMGQVWGAINAPAPKPATFQMDDVTQYWLHQAHSFLPDPNVNTFGAYFHGTLAGDIPVEITSRCGVPPMKGTPTFDTTTNSYVITTFVPNPAFSWRNALVHTIQTRTHPQPVNILNKNKGKQYPVTQ